VARAYRLGRRQASVDRTAQEILGAARRLLEESPGSALAVGAVAARAGVSRGTVYNRFGSRGGLMRALAPRPAPDPPDTPDAREAVRLHLAARCSSWGANPALYRHLPPSPAGDDGLAERRLAERLAAGDALRPGCSLREAEDVLVALASFATFDRLHKDGRRPPAAVAEILMRLAGGILA
jgi:AcrR family transcriptional regulator